jgi:proteasome lid subunit RPN8/RPN11
MSRAIYEQIRAHGEQTYPNECCGALLGRALIGQSGQEGWSVESAVRAENACTNSAHNSYAIAPLEVVKIESDASRRGLNIAGFYHSHPDHPAQWSPTDLTEAHWLGCSYVITSVVAGRAAITSSFLLAGGTEENKRFEEETIEVDGRQNSSD